MKDSQLNSMQTFYSDPLSSARTFAKMLCGLRSYRTSIRPYQPRQSAKHWIMIIEVSFFLSFFPVVFCNVDMPTDLSDSVTSFVAWGSCIKIEVVRVAFPVPV